jgi:hypothetical protein
MQALPPEDHEYAEWRLARVGLDYHVEVLGFFYSVPHALVREQVDTRATARTVEVFHRGKRVAAHPRRYNGPRHGTQPEHMPSAHRRHAEWTPERLQHQARAIGPNTETLILAVLARRPHPEQGFRTDRPRPAAAVPRPRSGPGRGGQPARGRDRHAVLRKRRFHPLRPGRVRDRLPHYMEQAKKSCTVVRGGSDAGARSPKPVMPAKRLSETGA